MINTSVTDIDFKEGSGITATAIHLENGDVIEVKDGDVVIMTNACMTDSATLGDLHTPAPEPELRPISGELWYKVAKKSRISAIRSRSLVMRIKRTGKALPLPAMEMPC